MWLTILLTMVTAAAMATVMIPLLRKPPPVPDRAEFDRAIYRRQLRELDRDAAGGLTGAEPSAPVRLEIQRRLLAVKDRLPGPGVVQRQDQTITVGLALVLPAAAAALYLLLGSPHLPDQPYAARAVERNLLAAARQAESRSTDSVPPLNGADSPEVAAILQAAPEQRDQMIRGMVEGLAARLRDQPDDLDGWLKLGRAYTVLDQPDQAAAAYRHAAELRPGDASLPLAAAQSLLSANQADAPIPDGVVALLHRVETIDPKQPLALWQLGMAAVQRGRIDEARGYWQRLLAVLPVGDGQYQTVSDALKAIASADGP